MATGNERRRRRGAPPRAFIGPLLMLALGAVAGALLWRTLMLEPPSTPATVTAAERLSPQDRAGLDRLLRERAGER